VSFENQIAQLRTALERGDRLVAIDVEAHRYTQKLTEVGISIREKGHSLSYNLRLNERKKLQQHDLFDFGETIWMDQMEVHAWITGATRDAYAFIGHSFKDDILMLRRDGYELPAIPYYDTANWSRKLFQGGQARRLGDVCSAYGVAAPLPHNGGNDARYTLDVMMAIVEAQP
jgi:hypothetical protein